VPTNAALATLDGLWSVLEPLGSPLAVMGGISLASWGRVRATRDVDVLMGVESEAVDATIDLLRQHGFKPKRHPPVVTVGEHRFVQFLYTPPDEFYEVQVDLLLADTALQKSAVSRRVRAPLPGVDRPVDVLNCDDLILFKLIAGRIIDRADAALLLRDNRDTIDFAYLEAWIRELKLDAEYAEIWGEAFPGEPLPR
jgi:hypothetical protein